MQSEVCTKAELGQINSTELRYHKKSEQVRLFRFEKLYYECFCKPLYLKWSSVVCLITSNNPVTPIRFGIAISPFIVSENCDT